MRVIHFKSTPPTVNMPGVKRSCKNCHKFMRSDNLIKHQKNCKPKNTMNRKKTPIDQDLIHEIINGTPRIQPNKDVKLPNLKISSVPEPKLKKLKMDTPQSSPNVFLPSSIEGLKEKLRILYAEYIAGNIATKPVIFEIIKKLCKLGVINDEECKCVCDVIEDLIRLLYVYISL